MLPTKKRGPAAMAMPLVTTVAEASLGLPAAAPTVQLTTEDKDD